MNKYNNSKIYKITNSINGDIYIGSTTMLYLCSRMNMHRMMCKDISGRRDSKLYTSMRNLGVKNFQIELLENYNCENKIDLSNKEQEYIDLLKPTLNMVNSRPLTNEDRKEIKKKWYNKVKNTEEYKQHKKEWYQKYKERKNKEGIDNK